MSPDFDFPPRGSITKAEVSENMENKKVSPFDMLEKY